jgi:hypothetical protein
VSSEKSEPAATSLPALNFTISVAERARAIVTGPPPWSLRLRRIEDLQKAIVSALRAMRAEGDPIDPFPRALERRLEMLNALVCAHNAYYPIEANLPRDLRTGRLMDMGEPWEPMEAFTAEALLGVALGASD